MSHYWSSVILLVICHIIVHLSHYWSSCHIIGHHVTLLAIMSHYWSSVDIIGHLSQYCSSVTLLVIMSHYWSSCDIIGHHVMQFIMSLGLSSFLSVEPVCAALVNKYNKLPLQCVCTEITRYIE